MYWSIMERTADERVRDYLIDSVGPEYRPIHGNFVRDAIPRSLSEISEGSGVWKWFVKGCLNRLKRKGLVERDGDKWKIAS
jgi:hypothetical protein